MYGKVMSISDEMMWRYYELLTDVQLPEIEKMKRESHPMEAKKDLARRIVTDFHSADAAAKAAEDWAKQFQKDEVPEDVEEVEASVEVTPDGRVRLDKLLAREGLAESVSDAVRKLKQNAVRVNGELQTDSAAWLDLTKPPLFWGGGGVWGDWGPPGSGYKNKKKRTCHPERNKPIRSRIGLCSRRIPNRSQYRSNSNFPVGASAEILRLRGCFANEAPTPLRMTERRKRLPALCDPGLLLSCR